MNGAVFLSAPRDRKALIALGYEKQPRLNVTAQFLRDSERYFAKTRDGTTSWITLTAAGRALLD